MEKHPYKAYVNYTGDASLVLTHAELREFYQRQRWGFTAADFIVAHPDRGAALTAEIAAAETQEISRISVVTINDGILVASPGVIATRFAEVISESVIYPTVELELSPAGAVLFTGNERRPGSYLALDGIYSQYFWHWMMEYVPRLLIATAAGFAGTVIISANAPAFVRESLRLLGVPEERIAARGAEPWWCEELWVPEMITGTAGHARQALASHPALLWQLRNAFRRPQESRRRIYVSRAKAARGRRVRNETSVLAVLQRWGFESLVFEDMTLPQQLEASSAADALIGPHGAGIVHSLFMPPGSAVIELYAEGFVEKTNAAIFELLNHTHVPVISAKRDDPYFGEFDVDLAALEAAVSSLLG